MALRNRRLMVRAHSSALYRTRTYVDSNLLKIAFVREVVRELARNDDPDPVAPGSGSISEPFGRLWVSIGGLTGGFLHGSFPKAFFQKGSWLLVRPD